MPVPKQSGHFEVSTFVVGTELFCSAASASICCFSFFQRRRRRCSARKAGTLETVVRPAAIFSSVIRTSASSSHFIASLADGSLPVISFVAFFSETLNLAKASSSVFSVLVLKEVLEVPEVSLFSTDEV